MSATATTDRIARVVLATGLSWRTVWAVLNGRSRGRMRESTRVAIERALREIDGGGAAGGGPSSPPRG